MTFGFILYPLMFIHNLFFNNNEGIFLFFRLSTFVIKIFIGIYIYNGLKQFIKKEIAILPFLIILPFNYLGTIIPGYTTLGICSFLLLSFTLFFYRLSKRNMYLVFAGIFTTTLVLSYPPFFILFFYYILALLLDVKDCKQSLFKYLFITIGAISIIFLFIYLINGKSILDVIDGMIIILTKIPYFRVLKSSKIIVIVNQLIQISKVTFPILLSSLIIVFIIIKFLKIKIAEDNKER